MAARDGSGGADVYLEVFAVSVSNDIRIDALALITNISADGK
jgi:hypothetical protein